MTKRWWTVWISLVLTAIASILVSKAPLARKSARVESPSQQPIFLATSDSPSTQTLKIAIGAFYAICIQRAFETAIAQLNDNPPRIVMSNLGQAQVSDEFILLALQLPAFLIWVSLYHIANVRIYFQVPESSVTRRGAIHALLTVTLGGFYFFGATIGNPSLNQLYLIAIIVALDAIFPLLLGGVLKRQERIIWSIRGVIQTGLVLWIILKVDESTYQDTKWSAILLALIVLQLVIGVPMERFLDRRAKSEEV